MENKQKFKTKTGFCHILTDKIVLTRDGIIGDVAELTTGNNINRIVLVYGLVAALLIYSGYRNYLSKDWLFFGIYVLVGIYLIVNLFKSLKLSATPIIDRNKIKKVEFNPANKFRTRSYFKVDFEQNDGQLKSRLIMLPGSLNDGTNETEKALEIMKKAGLIKNNVG